MQAKIFLSLFVINSNNTVYLFESTLHWLCQWIHLNKAQNSKLLQISQIVWQRFSRMAMVKGLGVLAEVQVTEVNITETRQVFVFVFATVCYFCQLQTYIELILLTLSPRISLTCTEDQKVSAFLLTR